MSMMQIQPLPGVNHILSDELFDAQNTPASTEQPPHSAPPPNHRRSFSDLVAIHPPLPRYSLPASSPHPSSSVDRHSGPHIYRAAPTPVHNAYPPPTAPQPLPQPHHSMSTSSSPSAFTRTKTSTSQPCHPLRTAADSSDMDTLHQPRHDPASLSLAAAPVTPSRLSDSHRWAEASTSRLYHDRYMRAHVLSVDDDDQDRVEEAQSGEDEPQEADPSAAAENRRRTHTCPTCEKTFNRPSSLRIHRLTHTGDKPFVCPHPGCGRAFNVLSNMRRHLRNHANKNDSIGSGGGTASPTEYPRPLASVAGSGRQLQQQRDEIEERRHADSMADPQLLNSERPELVRQHMDRSRQQQVALPPTSSTRVYAHPRSQSQIYTRPTQGTYTQFRNQSPDSGSQLPLYRSQTQAHFRLPPHPHRHSYTQRQALHPSPVEGQRYVSEYQHALPQHLETHRGWNSVSYPQPYPPYPQGRQPPPTHRSERQYPYPPYPPRRSYSPVEYEKGPSQRNFGPLSPPTPRMRTLPPAQALSVHQLELERRAYHEQLYREEEEARRFRAYQFGRVEERDERERELGSSAGRLTGERGDDRWMRGRASSPSRSRDGYSSGRDTSDEDRNRGLSSSLKRKRGEDDSSIDSAESAESDGADADADAELWESYSHSRRREEGLRLKRSPYALVRVSTGLPIEPPSVVVPQSQHQHQHQRNTSTGSGSVDSGFVDVTRPRSRSQSREREREEVIRARSRSGGEEVEATVTSAQELDVREGGEGQTNANANASNDLETLALEKNSDSTTDAGGGGHIPTPGTAPPPPFKLLFPPPLLEDLDSRTPSPQPSRAHAHVSGLKMKRDVDDHDGGRRSMEREQEYGPLAKRLRSRTVGKRRN